MAFNIKDFVSGLAVKIKSTPDGSNGEVTHHHVDSSALPAGAATAAKQDLALAELASIDDRLAAALPLPSGAATSAKQDTLAALVGEVQANPTANTVLDRLKAIAAALAGLLGVTPQMASGGNISAQTNNPGSTYAAFGSQACKQVTIVNDTGTTILVQQGASGVGVPIFDQSAFTFFGIANANALGVKRKDDGNTQVTVAARWEA